MSRSHEYMKQKEGWDKLCLLPIDRVVQSRLPSPPKKTRRVCELDVESEQEQAESEGEDLGEEELSPNDDEAPKDPEHDNDRDEYLPVRSASYQGRRAQGREDDFRCFFDFQS